MTKMSREAESLKHAIGVADFTPKDLIDEFGTIRLAQLISEMLSANGIDLTAESQKAEDIDLTPTQLDNLLYLVKTMIVQHTADNTFITRDSKKKKKTPLFSRTFLSNVYDLQSV